VQEGAGDRGANRGAARARSWSSARFLPPSGGTASRLWQGLQLASFPPEGSHYLRYLSDATLESDFAGEIFRGQGKRSGRSTSS